jgi:DNA-binding response OmpR family regulator
MTQIEETHGPLRILYIEDNPMDQTLVTQQLSSSPDFHIRCCDRFKPGMELLSKEDFDLLLLDLNLPDSAGGLDTYVQARKTAPDLPIVVYTSIDDETMGVNAVKKGADDYLVKNHTDGVVLSNALRHAFERHHMEAFFRKIVFATTNPVIVTNWKGIVHFMNPAAEEIFERKAEDWVGRVFGYPVDPDQPGVISTPKGQKWKMTAAETEFGDEVLNILHFTRTES